ncbi:MAG: hypothetical protein LQ343_001484 [Gyalolechia ehrenbergii]|nr:MAG: hypothetical protein LQ343_001484 [Gyalolechia ehrenbergii]
MPVSHFGLTVSHLPTSCSFFLAALTPLGYRYIGQIEGQIGFGVDDVEFFISQETASVKAGAAHIAFSAPSRSSVDAFFVAALKAGGRIHGEPAERDRASGYYSAAVLDFDENSIEVMHRREAPNAGHSDQGSGASRVRSWQKEVAKSTVSQAPQSIKKNSRVAVTNVMTPTIMVASPVSQAEAGDGGGSKAFIGTLLGAAAGAAVAYAMTKGEESSRQAAGSIAYQIVEAAKTQLAPSTAASQSSYPQSSASRNSLREPQALESRRSQLSAGHSAVSYQATSSHKPTDRLTITAPPPPQASTVIDTFVPPSEVPHYRRDLLSRNRTDGVLPSSKHSFVPSRSPSQSKPSRADSAAKTITLADLTPSRRSSIITEIRNPRDVPLPASKATSVASRREFDLQRVVLDPAQDVDTGTVHDSVAPSDSISQAGSKKSRGSKRSSRSHRGYDGGSQASEKTVKASGSRSGSRRASIMSLPQRPSCKTSVHRSVVSFLPGM